MESNQVVEHENDGEGEREGEFEGEISQGNHLPTFEEILKIVEEEETRLMQETVLNEDLISKDKKRGVCTLSEDKDFQKFLLTHQHSSDGGTFEQFIKERRAPASIVPMMNHCCQFVTYLKSKSLIYQQLSSSMIIETVASTQPVMFYDYLNFLLRGGGLKPGTVENRIDSLQYLIEWIRCSTNNDIYFKYTHAIERLKEERLRIQKINRKLSRENSIDNLVKKRRWVDDGVVGLQNMMLDSWRYFDALISLSRWTQLSRARYSWLLSYALASMWCLSINARVKSIETLTMKGFQELQEKKFHLSTSFKTASTYHYQVSYVIISIAHSFSIGCVYH